MKVNKYFVRWIGLGLALVLILGYCDSKADVVTCSDPAAYNKFACASQVSKPKTLLGSGDLILFCSSGVINAGDACAKQYWIPWNTTQPDSWVLTSDGWFRQKAIPEITAPPPPTFVYKKPSCMTWDLSMYYRNYSMTPFVAVWFCETPTGIVRASWAGNVKNIATTCAKQTDSQDAFEVHRLGTCRAKTADEIAIANSLASAVTAKVVNSTLSDGSVVGPPKYLKNPDGTRNTKSIGRAAKDQPCFIHDRIVSTSYYRLVDEDAYAQCVVTGKYVRLK